MQEYDQHIQNVTSPTIVPQQSKVATHEHRIDIGQEQSGLLGYEIFAGKLVLDKRSKSRSTEDQTGPGIEIRETDDAKLTSKALDWGSQKLSLTDVVSVTYNAGVQYFTVHAFPFRKRTCGLHCVLKPQRSQKDFRFVASSVEEALQWVSKFADQQFFINCLPHPTMLGKKQEADTVESEPLYAQPRVKSKPPPKVLVILNPRSGNGRSSKVFHEKVEPIFELAGFKMEVVKTSYAGHARKLASTVDFGTCPDGIICVGGDGIVNEVLNGLINRGGRKEAMSIPIGIIPAGSDNSLVLTILGVRDPISAAITIIKGGLTAMDVFAVEWIQTGSIHYGTTASYFGFVSDVLDYSAKYQKRFGPLRYFVAGFLKFLCLPKYSYELEYLPISKETPESNTKIIEEETKITLSDLYTNIMGSSSKESIPRASSLSSIDSTLSPTKLSGGDLELTGSSHPSSEPSEYVRGLDPKSKRSSLGRSNLVTEPEEVLHPQLHLSTTPNMPRTRSKSRTDKGWAGSIASIESRSSWVPNDKEDISSTVSDPGPLWDAEPKWDAESNWGADTPIQLPEPVTMKELVPKMDQKWVVQKGHFLAVLVCNHSCKTVQNSQVVAPKAVHDDNSLDLLLVHGSGRLKLLRFFVRLQLGRHLSLPFVEYVKVKSVKVRPGKSTHSGCGIDGELFRVNKQVICYLIPEQCRLIGRLTT